MTRRSQIAMTPEERAAYVRDARTIILCTHGPRGYPHAVAMWFVVDDDGVVWMSTYRKSQKALNVRRNAKVALHVESGDTYETLRGVLIRGDAEVVDDTDQVLHVIKRVHAKMSGGFPPGVEEALLHQARKRVAIKVTPRHASSWDHTKLGGTY